jgi:hypothetical protein
VPKAEQERAVHFLTTRGLETPTSLFDSHIVEQITPSGSTDDVAGLNNLLIGSLLNEARLHRLQDDEALHGDHAYSVSELFSQILSGAFSELDQPTPKIDVYRRNMQRTLLRVVDKAEARSKDKMTGEHLAQTRHEIELILEGRYGTPSGAGNISFGGLFGIKKDDENNCWSRTATLREAIKESQQ